VVLPRAVRETVEAFAPFRAGLFQFVRPSASMNHLHLRVGYEAEFLTGTLGELASSLREALTETLHVPTKIELTPVSELLKLGPPHKIPRVTKS